MPYTLNLKPRVALVTGGTRGIGLAIARQLASAGANVLVAGRKQDAVDAAVAELAGREGAVGGLAANVGDAEDRQRLVDTCIERYGRLDILVNNAAANPVYGRVEDTEPWAFAKIMQVNLEAPFELAKLALPHLRAHPEPGGNVVNISSIGGISPEPKLGIYSVSKAALNSLTRVLAKEWGRYNVRVNAVCPGLIKTDFSEALWSDERVMQHMTAQTPLRRIGEPDEIGRIVLALVSGLSAYTSGAIVTADGGYTI